jgi:hypothetical protein
LIEGCWPELRDPTFEIKVRQLTRLRRQHPQPPATIVFLGSSMTANGVNAAMIETPLADNLGRPVVAYNLGINGNGPLAHLVHVQRLLRRGIRPDLVFVEVGPLMCDIAEARNDLARFPGNRLEHGDLAILDRHAASPDLHAEWWQAHLVPIHGHRVMMLNQSARVLVPYNERVELWADADTHGWRSRPIPPPAEHRAILLGIEKEFTERFGRLKMNEDSVNALRELTELLAREQIAAVLVSMPEGPLMRSLCKPAAIQPVMSEFAAIGRKHGFPLIQARAWFGEEAFRDSYHLHEAGACAFTERLLREMTSPSALSVREWLRTRDMQRASVSK